MLAAIGALVALLTDCTIELERIETDATRYSHCETRRPDPGGTGPARGPDAVIKEAPSRAVSQ